MTLPQQSTQSGTPKYRTSLRRSLLQTLMVFTFIPLTLISGAAYFRSRTLLHDQVVSQMQTQITTQLSQVDLAIKTKEIRLDRLVRSQSFASNFEMALHANSQSTDFQTLRATFSNEIHSLTPETGKTTFNQFFLMRPDGTIQISSKPEWEGISLKETSFYQTIHDGDHQSFALYDMAPLYPNQFVLITISQYKTQTGSQLGTLVGISESQSLQEILQALITVTPSASAYFVTPSQTFIGTDPYTSQLTVFKPSNSQNASLATAITEMMGKEQAPRSLEFTLSDRSPVLAQVKWLSSINVGVVLEIHQDTIYGQLNSLIPFTTAIFLISLLAMGVVIWFGTNQVFKPLISLAEITRRYSEGDFSQRAEARRNDEIGLLAQSFNQMAEELTGLYRSLEQKVDERTRQIRTAAEVAQQITSSPNLDELLNRTTQLIVEQFDFYHAGIFMLDRGGRYALLRAAYSPAAKAMLERAYRLEVGSASVIGWVSANNQPRITSDVEEDSIHLKNELLPETRSEAGVPISISGLVLGVLDVQSTHPNSFGPDTMVMLQTLASQIAVAIQNIGLVESAQINFQEPERLYRSSHQIIQAQSITEVLSVVKNALREAPYISAIFTMHNGQLEFEAVNDPQDKFAEDRIPYTIAMAPADIVRQLAGESIFDLKSGDVPPAFASVSSAFNCQYTAFLPIMLGEQLSALIMIGSRTERLNRSILQPYASMADLTSITLEKIAASGATDEHLRELNALTSIGQIASTASDTTALFAALHTQVQNTIGNHSFLVALYDEKTDMIHIPYAVESEETVTQKDLANIFSVRAIRHAVESKGTVTQIDPFPLGDGLTSILIHSLQPLLLVEDTEKRATAMGAKISGRSAKSWMGAPMILNGKATGALIVQNPDVEHAFTENHMRFLASLAAQVAGVIYNIKLLEDSRLRAVQFETAAEIARDISSSLNLDELLTKAVNFIRERFNFYHAAIFLIDLPGEFAVIREATGEAGAQMKRAGHKLGVGSKSIVGYVAGRGEPLVISDTSKDPTYYANPLLPDTKAEAATPLKVGERILGVLDVQSIHPYAFNEDNLRTLQILTDQLAIAVVNSELFAETQEHLSQDRLLHHITTTAASGTTLEEALESAVEGLQVTLGGDRVSIMLMDRERKNLEIKAAVGYSEAVTHMIIPVGSGITGWTAAHRRPLRIDDVTADSRYIQASSNTRSELAIPLIYRNDVLGVLNVESEQPGAYTENDEEMLGTLGGSLAAVIANARLLEQIRSQAERERMLYEVTSKIRRSTDIQTILATTASELTKAVGARHASIKISAGTNKSDETSSKENN